MRLFLAAAILLVVPGLAAAQGNFVRPRITDRIDNTRLTVLQGNTHPLARAQYDQGAAPPNLPMDRMLLVLKRSPEQETALQDFLEQQQDTSSPNYHKWLTPDQFGQEFGPADQDIQAITSWLASYGFQSIHVSHGRTVIEFSGTASQVQTALHTAIHKYAVNAENHWANADDPQIPVALAPVVSGVVSLHDFRKKPLSVRSSRSATATVTPGAKPLVNFTGGSHGLAPADFDVIYNIGSSMTGAGTTIGVVARSNINVSDVQRFRSIFGLPANDPQVVLNGPDPGDLGDGEEAEAVLDATWPGAVAPSATVKLVVSEDTNSTEGVDLSEIYIIDNNLADVMTESFSFCEAATTISVSAIFSALAEQAAAQGITYLVASGDGGPDGCDTPGTPPTTLTAASVNLLASTPFTIAVGGTQFNDTASPSTYWKLSNGTNSESAISYIPENVWNESCTVATCGAALAGLWSSGGGQSVFFTKPPWQAGVAGIPSANARFVPDVSLSAADHDGYVLCLASRCQGSSPSFSILSGTSVSTQAFGGVMALVVQKTGARQGQANYVLYKLAASETLASCNGSSTSGLPNSSCIFNDVTLGNTNLLDNPSTPLLEAGFSAGTGYDKATGLGSVNVTNLLNNWNTVANNGSTTTLSLATNPVTNPITLTHGQSVNVSITVAPKVAGAGTPTGDVSLIAGTSTGQGADAFTLITVGGNGSVTSTTTFLPGSPVPGGSYNVTAHYAGDGTFLASDSPPVSVIVNPEASVTSLGIVTFDLAGNITSNNATPIVYGSPYILSVQVTNSASTLCNPHAIGGPACPTGTVALTDGGNPLDGGSFTLNSLGFFEDQPIQLSAGTHNIKAVYAGDNSFNGSTSSTDAVTVSQAATTTTVVAKPTAVSAGGTVTMTATVATQSNATASPQQEPTRTVKFLIDGVAFGSPVAVIGSANSSTGFAQAVATTSTATLANGQHLITAQYLGDSNYLASAVSSAVTVSVGTPGINLTPASNTVTVPITAPGQPGTQVITASAANGYTGTVSLACAVAPTNLSDTPTCSFTPGATITLTTTATSGQSTLNVKTTAASAIFKPANRPHGPNWFLVSEVAAFMACLSLLLCIPLRKWRGMAVLAVLIFAVIAVGTGCGSYNSNSGRGNPGTATGPYTVTVTATPTGATVQQTTITFNLQ